MKRLNRLPPKIQLLTTRPKREREFCFSSSPGISESIRVEAFGKKSGCSTQCDAKKVHATRAKHTTTKKHRGPISFYSSRDDIFGSKGGNAIFPIGKMTFLRATEGTHADSSPAIIFIKNK